MIVPRFVLFDLDGTLVDRQAALTTAASRMCRTLADDGRIQAWMISELADRASAEDFVRMREVFGSADPP
ncbi:hypothetical protein RB200_32155 [Streptomyces sp. PmtG]